VVNMMLEKVWGLTTCLLELPSIQVHRIVFNKGGVCSKHYHAARNNAFYVVSGALRVQRFYEPMMVKTDDMLTGDFLVVPAGVVHRFEGITAGVALEIYYPADVSTSDIVRLSQGFMR
jgi:quercetin dioxygenase-like cupin family protein